MKKKAIAGRILSGVLLFGGMVTGQEPGVVNSGPNEKAERYHKLLLKRPGNPTVFNRFVNAWLDTGDKDGMKAWLEESAKAGGSAEWRVLAAFHEYLGEDEAALGAFHKAVTGDDQDAALRLGRAKLHAKLLSFEAALEDLKVATADEKLGVEASKLMGIYLARAGRVEEAVKAWKEVIERFPKDEELREDLIEVEVAEGLYDDAIEVSQALVAMTKDPYKKALRQLRLGDIQIVGNKREEGLKTYETIMAATGADTWLEREVLAQVERVFMREDDIQGLRDFFQKLREDHPRRVSVRKALARQMALNGEMDEAVALFREVLKITPGDIGNREEFIAFLETNERWKEAQEELAELIKLREGDPLLWERMAQIEEKQNHPEGVKAALAKVRDLKKGTPEGLIAVAALYTQADFLPEAEALLREGKVTFGDSDELSEALASFLIQNEKEAEALAIWTEMAKTAGREGLLRVSRSLTGHGKSEEAFQLLQGRMTEFEQDPLILAQFCSLAASEEEAVIAVPYGLEMVRQATSPTDLDAALKIAGRVIKKAEKLDETLAELEGKQDALISERCLITDLYLQQGDTLRALEVLTAAEKADEGLLARFYRVRYEESQGELDKAIASLRAIIELPQGRKTVHLRRLVGLLENNDDLPGALAAVDDWKRMAPGDQAAWKRRADLLAHHGEADKAVLELRRMIGKFGAEEDSRAKLAGALLEANEHRSAQRIYEQLYEEGEDLTTKLKWVGELAQLAQKEGTLDELLSDFERRKRENANSVAPLLALAEIHHTLNQYEERRSALLEASRRRPNDIKLLQHIAEVEVRAGEFDRAVGLLKDAAKRDATPGTKQKLAKLFLQNGEYQEGLRMLKELPDHSDDPRKVESTALSLMSTSEFDLAVEYLAEFLPKHSADWRLRYLYAVALETEGDEEEALAIYMKLLEADQKIKGLKLLYDPKVYRGGRYFRQVNSATEMKGWAKFGAMNDFVNSDRQRQNQTRWNRSYLSAVVNLPGDVEEVQLLSLVRATFLVKQYEKEKRDELLKKLTTDGVERFDLYDLRSTDPLAYFNKVDELLKADPDNAKLLTLWISAQHSAGKDYKVEPQRFAELLKSASKQGQDAAVSLISSMLYRGNVDASEAVKLVVGYYEAAETEKEKLSLLSTLTYMASRQLSQKKGDEFRELAQILIADAVAIEKKPKAWNWMNTSMRLAVILEDHTAAITLFNRVSGWMKKDSSAASPLYNQHNNMRWGSHYGHQNGSLSVPSFPPNSVKGFPQLFSRQLKLGENQKEKSLSKEVQRRAELLAQLALKNESPQPNRNLEEPQFLEIFRGRTAEIESPLIRALIGASLGEENAMSDFVASVADSKDYEELEVAAGYLWKEKKQIECYEILCRMRMLTLSRAQRGTMDGRLAKVGSILAGKEEEWEKEPAQRAALRLRKVMLNQNDKQALYAVLVKLGLQKEADKVGKVAMSSTRGSSTSHTRNKQGIPLVVSLVANGRREEAARSAAKLIRSYQKNSNSQYEMANLIDALKKLEMVDATLAKIHPGESKSASRRLAYAELAQGVGRSDLAKPLFRELLEERPDLAGARVGLYMCLTEEEKGIEGFLGEVGEDMDFESLHTTMSRLWEGVDNQFEPTVAMLDATAQILESIEPSGDAKRNLSWVPYHIAAVLHDNYYNGINIASLMSIRSGSSYDKAKTKLLDEAAKNLIIAMMKHPQIAKQGFMCLSKAQDNLKLTDEEMSEYAQKALIQTVSLISDKDSRNYGLWSKYTKNGSSTTSYSINDAPAPLEYLISKGGAEGSLLDDLLPTIKESQPKRYASMVRAKEMLSGSPEEAIQAFDEWYKKLKSEHEESHENIEKTFAELVSLGRDVLLFKPEVSVFTDHLEAELLKIYSSQWNDNSGWNELSKQWLGWIAVHKDQAAVRAFILGICETAAGPQEQWPILAELGANHLPNHYRARSYSLNVKLSSYCKIEEAVMPVFDIALEGDFKKFVQNFYLRNLLSTITNGLEDGDSFVTWIKKTGVLNKRSAHKLNASAVLASLNLMDNFPNRGSDFSKEVLEKVKPLDLDPLLKALLTHRYSSSDEKVNMAVIWEERTELLKSLLEVNRPTMLTKMKVWFPDFKAPDDAPKLKLLLSELRDGSKEKLRKEAEQWLVDGIEIDENDYQGRNLWTKIVKISEMDVALGMKLVNKVFEALEEKQPSNPFAHRGGSRSPKIYWASSLFDRLEDSKVKTVTKIKMIDAIYRGDLGSHLGDLESQGSNVIYYLRNGIQREITAFKIPEDSKRKKIELAFMKWAKDLNPEQEMTFAALALPAFIRNRDISSKEVDGVMKWADEELRKESELMADVLMILAKVSKVSNVNSKEREPLQKEAAEFLATSLARLDLPSPLAVDFIYGLTYSSSTRYLLANSVQWEFIAKHWAKLPNGVRDISRSNALRIFERLSQVEFSGKKESTQNLLNAINGTLLTPELLLQYRNSSSGRWLKALLPLTLEAGNNELAKKLIQQNSSGFRGELRLMLDVAAVIDVKTAVKLAPATSLAYSTSNLPGYTKELTPTALALSQALPARERYRFEVMVASLNDSSEKGQVPELSRAERMKALVKRYAKEAPKDNGPRWQVLNRLASDEETKDLLREEFKKEASKTTLSAALVLKDQNGSNNEGDALLKVIQTWLTMELEAGRYEVMIAEIKKLSQFSDGRNSYSIRNIGRALIIQMSKVLWEDCVAAPEKAASFAKLSRDNVAHYTKFTPSYSRSSTRGLIWADLMIHLLAGESKEWYERAEKVPEDQRVSYNGPLGKDDRWGLSEFAKSDIFENKDRSDERVAFLSKAFADPLFVEKVMGHYSMCSSLVNAQIVQKTEFFKVVDALPQDHSHKAEWMMMKAKIMVNRDSKKLARALKVFTKARALALSQKKENVVHLCDALHARILAQKKRRLKAWEIGQRVNADLLPKVDQKWFAKELPKWKKAATESAKPKKPKQPAEK